MSLYNAKGVEFSFGAELLFRDVSFEIERSDKIGLVGRNGCGKTTLFKLMRGEYPTDGGELVKSRDATLGYMEQHVVRDSSIRMYDEVLSVFAPLLRLEEELEELHREIDGGKTDPARLEKQMRLSERFEAEGGLTCRARAKSSLLGLGFSEAEQEKPVSVLSGGEKAKVQLAKLLLSGANLLLLDEPTNHLDLAASAWLEKFLLDYRGAYLVISHDRYFLDRVTTRTFELENKRLTAYKGGYTLYRRKKEEDLEAAWRHYENQTAEIERIRGIIEQQKRFNQAHNYITIASKEKQIERLEAELVKPEAPPKKLRFRFHCTDPVTDEILTAKNLSVSFEGRRLFRAVDLRVRKHERVFLLGANGSGKTTLFKMLMKEIAGDAGSVAYGPGVKVGYYDQLMTGLSDRKTVLDELWDAYPKLSQTEARTALGSFLFGGEEVFKRVGSLSGGEKARIALLKLMMSGCNLLLLDEPTNHLDITSREALEAAIEGFDGTALIISHDRYLIRRTATRVFRLTPEGVEEVDDLEAFFNETEEKTLAVKKAPTGDGTGKAEYLRKKELQSERRKCKTRAARAEERIAALEAEIKALGEQMQDPSNAADFEKIAALGEALAEAQRKLDEQTEEWIAASDELAELEKEG
ncbi:MAG: ABC-F family ATP-binding cassette domain-containing protein [Bacteroides sp.]|nr:ABC-F family ATP-binding cassette domain-containing protein [Eubacterium sp.]MCM1419454.1 ABC-F family ATP-binding cassette domain-containing protein [Roseburia sp.]MCM1463278.1 ABC-F family ATP-binding cassette domain-containing protein [Bacteroides sp.]